jgi:hypothetical protein
MLTVVSFIPVSSKFHVHRIIEVLAAINETISVFWGYTSRSLIIYRFFLQDPAPFLVNDFRSVN